MVIGQYHNAMAIDTMKRWPVQQEDDRHQVNNMRMHICAMMFERMPALAQFSPTVKRPRRQTPI